MCAGSVPRVPPPCHEGQGGFFRRGAGPAQTHLACLAPSLYGQFPGIHTRAPILEGLCRIGFDQVFEVAEAAEAMSAVIHRELRSGSIPHPIITTACPVILRVVRIRFPLASAAPAQLPLAHGDRRPLEQAPGGGKDRSGAGGYRLCVHLPLPGQMRQRQGTPGHAEGRPDGDRIHCRGGPSSLGGDRGSGRPRAGRPTPGPWV